MTKRFSGRAPTHPGEILREDVLPALDISKTEFAAKLGVSRMTLYDLLNQKIGVSPEMAVRLGKLLGNGPQVWLNLQAAHDLWHAERTVDVSAIPTLKAKDAA